MPATLMGAGGGDAEPIKVAQTRISCGPKDGDIVGGALLSKRGVSTYRHKP